MQDADHVPCLLRRGVQRTTPAELKAGSLGSQPATPQRPVRQDGPTHPRRSPLPGPPLRPAPRHPMDRHRPGRVRRAGQHGSGPPAPEPAPLRTGPRSIWCPHSHATTSTTGSGHPIANSELEPSATLDERLPSRRHFRVWYRGGFHARGADPLRRYPGGRGHRADLYDTIFTHAVSSNSEDTVSARALPIRGEHAGRTSGRGRLSRGAAATLHLAWFHRATHFPR